MFFWNSLAFSMIQQTLAADLWLLCLFKTELGHLQIIGSYTAEACLEISTHSLLFHSSILDTFWPGDAHLPASYLFAFHTVHGVLQARILEWVAISFSGGPRLVRTLHYDLFSLGWPCLAWLIDSLRYTSPFTTAGCDPWSGESSLLKL